MMGMMSKSGKAKIQTKVGYGNGRGKTSTLKLQCDHTCLEHFKFVQQAGWSHHFLPVCACKENPYFQLPKHIPSSQYEMYMLEAVSYKNQIIFIKDVDDDK